jgi:hypothetical protein
MARKKLEQMSIRPAANGGMVIRHEYKRTIKKNSKEPTGIGYDRPEDEEFVFGPDDHDKAMAHITKHLRHGSAKEEADPNEEEPDNDQDD